MIDKSNISVGTIVKDLRIKHGMTQEELARGICSKQHIYRIEKGSRLPSAYLIKEINQKLHNELVTRVYSHTTQWQ